MISLCSIAGLAFAYSDTLYVDTSTDVKVMTEYKCQIQNVHCVVDRVKYMKSGATYYDAECNADHMTKSAFENDVRNDVETGTFNYCSRTGRTLN